MRKKTTTVTPKYLYLLLNFKCHLQKKINYLNNGRAATSFHMSSKRAISNEIPQG